jgi:putative redox protein
VRPFTRKGDERERRMKAISRRQNGVVRNDVEIRGHRLVADEPTEEGGEDQGPSPLELLAGSLASCTAITMQMYADRKGWDIGEVQVGVDYQPAQRGAPTRFELVIELPKELPEDQRTRLMQIAAKCPVHRTLEGEVMFDERLDVV